ncbi:hypothetical protein Ancab_035671 [Ancistrocladus abbreviatus]
MRKRKAASTTHKVRLPVAKICGVEMRKHRSCWKHVVASLYGRQEKVTKKEVEKIRMSFERSSPCFLGTYPTQERSPKLRAKRLPIQRKLDSGTFEQHLENLWRNFSEERRKFFTHLDSLWFALYLKSTSKEKVLSWIKKKHIFSKKYVFVPIVCWRHWSLLIFCHFTEDLHSETRKPCMLLLDSLETADPRRIEPEIRKFVLDIYRAEGIMVYKQEVSRIPLLVPKVPQQKKEECGSFVLYFIKLFVQAAPENFSIAEGYPYFMNKNWFTRESFEGFCNKLDRQSFHTNETNGSTTYLLQHCSGGDIIVIDD